MKQEDGKQHRTRGDLAEPRQQLNPGRDIEYHRRCDEVQCENAVKQSFHDHSFPQQTWLAPRRCFGVFPRKKISDFERPLSRLRRRKIRFSAIQRADKCS